MNEQITEQTNNSAGVPGTGAESGAGTSTAVASSVATENSSADNINGAIDTEPKEGEGNAQKEGAGETAPKQDNSKNREMARQRRERETAAKIEQARIEAIKSVLSENPYTRKPIEDDSDVKEYLLMKQIEKDGKDPISDYPEYVKKQEREAATSRKSQEATNEKITNDLEEFAIKHPGVNVNDVFGDKLFESFAEGKLGKKSLSEVYSAYLPIKEAMASAKRDSEKSAHDAAVKSAAVGSVTNASAPPEQDFFTKEQVQKMSKKEIHDNYEKIRKSQEKW